MRDNLLGYLLGALDAAEHEQVEQALQRHPHLRNDLEKLRRHIVPLDGGRQEHQPPSGLASRTCLFVQERAEDGLAEQFPPATPVATNEPTRRAFSPSVGESGSGLGGGGLGGLGWSAWDLSVAALVFVAAALLFFPAIARSRHASQVAACQNNLRVLGTRLALYCQQQGQGRFPYIPAGGNESFAGMYATVLDEHGLLPDQNLLVCPASNWAERAHEFRVPTRKEIREAVGEHLVTLQRMGGGSYAYNIGFLTSGRHLAPRNQMRSQFAIMADAPQGPPANGQSGNHGGSGLNLLYEDGHVEHVRGCLNADCPDHPLLNDDGLPEVGLGENDAVVVRSEMPPLIRPVVLRP